MARRTGAKTRSRIASETPSTMWQREPYFPEAASQSVVMVTQEIVVRSAAGWTTCLKVGPGWSHRNAYLARVSVVSEGQEDGTPDKPQIPRWRARQRAEPGVQTRPKAMRRRYLLELENRVSSPTWCRSACDQMLTRGGAFVVV